MTTTNAQFACIRYAKPIGKSFELNALGTLQKKVLANGAVGVAHTVNVNTIAQLETAFRTASNTDIFVGGVSRVDGVAVTSKAKRGEGNIARSKDDLEFPTGPGVMFLDNDHPVGEGDDQFNVYVKAVPALNAASYVYAPSSSAWIFDAESGEVFRGAGGQHYAVPVQDATDIPRALKTLHRRLILAGFGQALVTKAGTVLIKSPVDTALQTPSIVSITMTGNKIGFSLTNDLT
jgi:hypothetical protein